MSDRYDKAVKYLTEHPGEIFDAWQAPMDHPGGCLFLFAQRETCRDKIPMFCGCLTQVRSGCQAQTRELTEAIQADQRIPQDPLDITVEHLPVFAEWQARIDRELRNKDEILK